MDLLTLTYAQTVPLPLHLSIVGIAAIAAGVVGVAVGTTLTKGKIPSPTIYYLDSPQSEGYTCNSTLVYPGQTFGAISLNSSFQYQALNNFAYQGEALTNCAVANATYLDVVGPPISWPRFGWNHTLECNTQGPLKAKFAIAELFHLAGTNTSTQSLTIWDEAIILLQNLTAYTCGNTMISAFRVDEDASLFTMFSSTNKMYCPEALSKHPNAVTLMASIKEAMAYDFSVPLKVLPGLLYPCTQTKTVWAPTSQIAWDILTSTTAFLGTLIYVVIKVLRYFHEPETIPFRRQSSIRSYDSSMPLQPNSATPFTGNFHRRGHKNSSSDQEEYLRSEHSPVQEEGPLLNH